MNVSLSGALLVQKTENKKLGNASALYVSLNACPTECPFRAGNGCYAEVGPVALQTARLSDTDGHTACLSAAMAIRHALSQPQRPDRPLRLFVTGDAHCIDCAREIAEASRAYQRVTGKPVWGYTHAWRRIPASVWHGLAVRASCETDSDVRDAAARGYAVARVFPDPTPKSFKSFMRDGMRYVACLEQTIGRKCSDCRICWNALHLAIAFTAHGSSGARSRAIRAIERKEASDE